jgi:hypothetical protein
MQVQRYQYQKRLALPTWQATATLTFLVFIGYGSVINSYFLADDFSLIQAVVDTEGGANWSTFIRHLSSGQNMESFRPLVTLFHLLGVSIWGMRPAGYHLLNLCFHLLNGLCLYALVATLYPYSRLIPFVSAALFLTHPLHPEAVTYIGSLPGVGCAAFYLMSAIAYAQYRLSERSLWLVTSLFAFAFALGMKEEAVSLPFMVSLITVCYIRRPFNNGHTVRLAKDCAKYFLVLGFYFVWRRYIFGHMTPPYFSGWSWSLVSSLRGVAVYCSKLAVPVNLPYVEPYGQFLYYSILALLLGALLASTYRRPPRLFPVLFCVAGLSVFFIPISKVLVFGIDPGLTNSRYAYFPSLAFVTGTAFILFSGKKETVILKRDILIVALLVVTQTGMLITNNGAWGNASELMRLLQREGRRLTGNRINVEVVNLPDTIDGVLFGRSAAFQRALLRPFVPDNDLHHRERIVTVEHDEYDLRVEGALFEPPVFDWRIDRTDKVATTPLQERIRLVFQPREAKTFYGEIIVRSSRCNDSKATIPVYGQGTTAVPLPTYLAAAVRPALISGDSNYPLTYLAAVADIPDGVAAEGVAVSLLAGVSWDLEYIALAADGSPESRNTPASIPDGGTKHFLLRLRPIGSSQETFLVPRIAGVNAPPVFPVRKQTTIELPSNGTILARSEQNTRRNKSSPFGQHDVSPCAAVRITPPEVDFGLVPISSYTLGPQPFSYLERNPSLLFWDDHNKRLLPFSQVDKSERLLRLSGVDLSKWSHTGSVTALQISPSIVAMEMKRPGELLESPIVNISPSRVAYLLVKMRIINAPSAYAVFWWMDGNEQVYRKWASVVTVPDGYWHTYAIPLHSNSAWQSSGPIRRFQFAPILSSGQIELASLELVGPVP